MSVHEIHLEKLLKVFGMNDRERVAVLREDIQNTIKKENGYPRSSGGHFYVPFWSDAKLHVSRSGDLRDLTDARIEADKRKSKLYPKLRDGFLQWWEERRRSVNEEIHLLEDRLASLLPFEAAGGTVKVENFLSFEVGSDRRFRVYGYFDKLHALSSENARLGLWALRAALPHIPDDELRILDVRQAREFSLKNCPLQGGEGEHFERCYHSILLEWKRLRSEYS